MKNAEKIKNIKNMGVMGIYWMYLPSAAFFFLWSTCLHGISGLILWYKTDSHQILALGQPHIVFFKWAKMDKKQKQSWLPQLQLQSSAVIGSNLGVPRLSLLPNPFSSRVGEGWVGGIISSREGKWWNGSMGNVSPGNINWRSLTLEKLVAAICWFILFWLFYLNCWFTCWENVTSWGREKGKVHNSRSVIFQNAWLSIWRWGLCF